MDETARNDTSKTREVSLRSCNYGRIGINYDVILVCGFADIVEVSNAGFFGVSLEWR